MSDKIETSGSVNEIGENQRIITKAHLSELAGFVLDDIGQMVQISDLDTFSMLYANEPARRYTSHGNESYLGVPCYKYMMGLDEQCPFCPLRKLNGQECAETMVDNGKEIFAVKTRVISWNGRRLFAEYATDITENQRSKAILMSQEREKEKHIKEQYEVLKVLGKDYLSICVINAEEETLKVLKANMDSVLTENENSILRELKKIPDSYVEMCHKYIEKFVVEEEKEKMLEAIKLENVQHSMAESGAPGEYSITYGIFINGEHHDCQVKYKQLDDDGNIIMAFRFVDQIIAEEKERQRELAEAVAAAEQAYVAAEHANQAKTTFLNNMSRDIRTPMNAILGFTALASTHVEQPEIIKDYLGKIMAASNHLLSLINDVLDMSRIESGKLKIEEKECNLSTVIHDLRNMIQSDIRDKRLELFIDTLDVVDENIICDRLRLNQILLNILSNAVKFTNPGGAVSIRVIQHANTPEEYADFDFIIRDNGIGMSSQFVTHIFEPFTREESSAVSAVPGTGLGMAITKNLVDMMNGQIGVESELGKGTEFTVSFRFLKGSHTTKRRGIKNLEGFRALVVDDSTDNCLSTSKMLRVIGLRPDWTISGKEAIVRAKFAAEENDEYRVYIIDWLIPDMNGIEVARHIRKEVGEGVPIIILTAYDWSDIEEEAKEAGVTAFCAKPLFLSELYSVLQEASDIPEKTEEEKPLIIPDEFKGRRILLVDDVEMNREIAETILQEAGIQVEMAHHGKEAVEIMEHARPGYFDMVLMDVMMPIMDGYEATRRIRKLGNPEIANVPIIAMTANAFEEDRMAALDAGMNEHLAKPFKIEELHDVMQQFIKM